MDFNASKCKVICFNGGRKPFNFKYNIHSEDLELVNSHKYLGVTLNSNMKWSEHIDNIVCKANKQLGFVKRNLRHCSCYTRERAYFALVRPQVEYACSLWDPHTSLDIHKLEMIQRKSARFVKNNYIREEGVVTGLMRQLGWS